MTRDLLLLEDCTFSAEENGKGQFIGRVKEFPRFRTRPQKSSLDALSEIMTLTSEHLRNLHSAAAGFGPARRNV